MPLFRREESATTAVGGLETVLGSTTNLKGVLKSDGNIRVDGVLQGTIETAGNLVVGPSARVVADIRANAVQVWGQIQGNIQTVGRLEILSSGRVFGEVTVGSLMIDEGGLFRGQCFMDGQDVDELLLAGEPRLPRRATRARSWMVPHRALVRAMAAMTPSGTQMPARARMRDCRRGRSGIRSVGSHGRPGLEAHHEGSIHPSGQPAA